MSGPIISEEDAWFHGNITREDAEALLKVEEEGTFLVRDSSTSIGDYALSVFANDEVLHIQICRHDRDAFFSIEEGNVIHGLDELIKFYQKSSTDDHTILLKKPLINSPPPPDCRRHGRTNLLHRATKEGNTSIVLEMVRCGYRSLDAKNDEGQTAAHLASINGCNEILSILIDAGTNVNAKDSASCSPLHYACIYNHPENVKLLMHEGMANPQLRRNETGWVPLHEAASRGHTKCVRMLLQFHAPLRPRTVDNKLPTHLAIENNHQETIQFFDAYKVRRTRLNRDDWYHSLLERQEALQLLQQCQIQNNNDSQRSYFLLRRSSNKPKVYVLTLLFQGHPFNFEIGREHSFFYIDDGPYLDSLEHIVDHYSRWSDGLPATLQTPIGPTQSFADLSIRSSSSNSLDIPPPLPRRIPLSTSPNGLRSITDTVNNNNKSEIPFSKENIAYELIELGDLLGSGEYGEVYEGKLRKSKITVLDVAIKTLKAEGEMREWTKKEFLQEAKVMMDLEHENIVKIIGICWQPRIYMVQELLELGSLQEYLVNHKEEINPEKQIRIWANQVAKGMVYLQNKRFVHRDLAARNILLNSVKMAKLSDFGLSRALGFDSNYYTASHGGRWPIKWYAPESCTHGTFSHASDVWSYGITLWEMYSYGETPYGDDLSGKDVIEMVEKGGRLEKPEDCPVDVFNVMKKCWAGTPDHRPTFKFLEHFFSYSELLVELA